MFNGNDQSSYNNNDYNTCQAELTIITIAEGTSNSNIGTFKINVYVLNAIDSISCVTPDSTQPFEYKANYSGLYFAIDAIEATRTRPAIKTNLQPNETTFSMQYLSSGWYYDFDETNSETAGNRLYGITVEGEFHKVFEYYANNNRIYFVADPFLVGFNCNVTLSSIRIEYETVSPDYYDQTKKTCYRNYSLVRHADSVALFSDKTYQTKVDTNKENNYVFELNQYEHGALYASAIVQNPNGKDEESKEIIVSKYDANAISACEGVYMNVPATIGLSSMGGTPYSNVTNAFTAISFDAPPVAGINQDSQSYTGITLRREYNQADQIGVIIIVKNAARPIDSMEIYDYDEEGQERALSTLQFGKFEATDDLPYTKTFYVRIKYAQAKVGTYVYFMSAELTLPSYLRLSLNDAAYLEVADKYTIGQEIVSDEDGGSNIDESNVVYTLKCTVQLIPEVSQYHSGKEEGDRILLKCAALDTVTEARARVATGIKSVSYTVDVNDSVSSENNNVKDLKI
ncbi:MAG: hypothetical protein K2M48_01630, partial [Clostridiales bacterium]|nr:hypothetical protein [Clostridiales bacterium]